MIYSNKIYNRRTLKLNHQIKIMNYLIYVNFSLKGNKTMMDLESYYIKYLIAKRYMMITIVIY